LGGTELAGRFIAAGCFFVTLGGSELAGRFKLVILLCWVGATDEARLVLDDCDVAADVGVRPGNDSVKEFNEGNDLRVDGAGDMGEPGGSFFTSTICMMSRSRQEAMAERLARSESRRLDTFHR
jgi:hypothetical protein